MSSSREPEPTSVQLVLIPAPALQALLDNALGQASRLVGLELPPFFLTRSRLWQLRLNQICANPESAPWLIRAVHGRPANAVIGMAGFHGPPNSEGMVEIGYTIVPEFRRQGYGRAAALALMDYAAEHPDVRVVRASVSPDNVPSLRLVRSLGFQQTGEQWDEEDGLELVLERSL